MGVPPGALANSRPSGGLGDFVGITLASPLESGAAQGSGGSFTLTALSPVFDPTAIAISDLRLYWGFNTGQTTQPFGTFQSNAVPEPSAYAALLGLVAFGCVALRRRAL